MSPAAAITVAPVREAVALEAFLRLPWAIYRDDPCWVPPLLPHQRRFLDPEHGPFFEIGKAQYFLAYRAGEPAGRLSAHINHLHDEHHGPGTGFFGFFESVNDLEVAEALFEAAAGWLKERGCTRLAGPLNFCIYDEMGLLVDGFDSIPAIFQTHNPPYYQDLLTSLGFAKAMDWYALRVTDRSRIDAPVLQQVLEKIMAGSSLTFAPFDLAELDRRAAEVHALFNESWSRNWGHVPITKRQFDTILEEMKPLLRAELVNLILDNDRLIAFGIAIPDLYPLVQKLNGNMRLWANYGCFTAPGSRPWTRSAPWCWGYTSLTRTGACTWP